MEKWKGQKTICWNGRDGRQEEKNRDETIFREKEDLTRSSKAEGKEESWELKRSKSLVQPPPALSWIYLPLITSTELHKLVAVLTLHSLRAQ